jgi:predicted DNA-binding transcriptional regulator YafY
MAIIYSEKMKEGFYRMKIDRIVSIIMLLIENERMGAKTLSEMFEVSLRTIYRDIETINIAGIPIRSTPGVGGGFQIMDEYKVDKKLFSNSDIVTILMGLGSISTLMNREKIAITLAKIKSFVPTDKQEEISFKANQISIDLKPWMGNSNIHKYLDMTKTALQEQRILLFGYSDRYGNISTRTAEPHRLILKDNHWYIQGFCLKNNDFRLFKLSRISNLQLLEDTFAPRKFHKSLSEFTEKMSQRQSDIKLRVHKSITDKILEYCSFEHFSEETDDYYIVDFPFVNDDFGYNLLFSFGDKCECLEPDNVRSEMKRRIKYIDTLYAMNKD